VLSDRRPIDALDFSPVKIDPKETSLDVPWHALTIGVASPATNKASGKDRMVGVLTSRAPSKHAASEPANAASFGALYRDYFDLIWRGARAMGVGAEAIDDVVQEVFLVVHRRLHEFEGRSSLKTWMFGILTRVVLNHRRSLRRSEARVRAGETDARAEGELAPEDPQASLERLEAARLVERILETMDDDKRAVFVLAEIEQMSVREVAEALGLNVNTAASRLRAARASFEQAAEAYRALPREEER
jgi:RNA polymerase sigma-70 factor (ECF subfamily)